MFCWACDGEFVAGIQRCPVCDLPPAADPPRHAPDRILSEEKQLPPPPAARP